VWWTASPVSAPFLALPVRWAQYRIATGRTIFVDATAFAHRDRQIVANIVAVYMRAEESAVHEPWVTGFAAALRRAASGAPGAYVNFLADEGAARVREAYPGPTWEMLTAVEARYDPTTFFRLNQNIPPARRTTWVSVLR
jgi:Berberine and berberine like